MRTLGSNISLGAGGNSMRLTRKCTCAVETESDSDGESENGLVLDSSRAGARATSSPPALASDNQAAGSASGTDSTHQSSSPVPFMPPAMEWAKSLSLLELTRKTSGVRDPLKTSQALHNAEALRQASALENVFCGCYDVETVLTTVQRRERGRFSPMQKLLLEPESIKQVFRYATSFRTSSRRRHSSAVEGGDFNAAGIGESADNEEDPERYRQPFIATEIILRFYLKAMAWYGEPMQMATGSDGSEEEEEGVLAETVAVLDSNTSTLPLNPLQSPKKTTNEITAPPSDSKASPMMSFRSSASTRKVARNHRLRSSMRFESSSSSFSTDNEGSEDEGEDVSDNPVIRGYLLRIEDLTADEWKEIFGGLFRFMWPKHKPTRETDDAIVQQEEEDEVDAILAANMCRITKNFVIFPAVHRLINDVDEDEEQDSLFARLAAHAYNPEIASLLHGLIHLSLRRGYAAAPIVRCLVERIVEQVPSRSGRSISSVSSSSTVSSTSSVSPRASLSGASAVSSASFFSSGSAPLSPTLFTAQKSTVHARISGCAEILAKILTQELPNTFRYYIQTKVQLASFENVESFERELFPPKTVPSDPAIHDKLNKIVLASLTETSDVLMRLAELGIAELRFLDAHQSNGVCIPSVLVIDVFRRAIEASLSDAEQLEVFISPVHHLLDTVCASINYHQHLSTISEFAARDCFSDDEDDDEDGGDDSGIQSASARKSEGFSATKPPSFSDRLAGRSSVFLGISPPALCYSPTSGKTVINHRPLASTLLVMHVVELLDVIIRMANDRVDSQLTRLDLATSLMDIFEKFPKANILHCRLVKLYLNLLNRPASNGRVNNPLLRSIFRSPDSILAFIFQKLHTSGSTHSYDAHLAIIGVKIAKICSSPTLQQELIRQYCNNMQGWMDFASSLVASHYQQMDALDDSFLGLQSAVGGAGDSTPRGRCGSDDDFGFPLARPSSSASEYLSHELEPFRRLPMEKEGIGSAQNLARGKEAVHPSDMFNSRSQSKFPESISDILREDTTTSFDAEEDDFFLTGFVYQKRSKWVKVHLKFEKSTCQLELQDAADMPASESTTKPAGGTKSPSGGFSAPSIIKQFLKQHAQAWSPRPKKLVVCNARKWIAFGRSVKKPGVGAFGFQVEAFDGHREQDETLTFVARSEEARMHWFEAMQHAVSRSRSMRKSFSQVDETANIALVQCVAKNRLASGAPYLVVPDVNLLGPVTSANFFITSEVPEELPFWGTYHGEHGTSKYVSLFNQCLQVVSVEEKSMQASGYSVIVEFEAVFRRADSTPTSEDESGITTPVKPETPAVKCTCTDTYLISGNQIIGLTRTIADSEKLLQLLEDEE